MARKTLLTEAEIRSFMKLANLTPVGDARLQEWSPPIEEEELPDEEEEEVALDDAAPDADPAPAGDMEMDMSMDDEEPGMRDMMEARVNRIAARVAQRLMAENKKASNIDALTERIFNRLAGK